MFQRDAESTYVTFWENPRHHAESKMSPASRGGRRRSRIQSMSVKSSIDPMRRDEVPCFDSGYKTSSTKTSLYSYQAKQPMDMSWGLRGDIPCSILKSITIKSPYLVKDDNGIEVVSQIGPENSGCFLDDDSPTKRATSQRYQLLHAIDLEALPDFETNDFESYNRDSDQPGVNDILYYNDLMEDTVAPHGCRMDDQRCIVKDITLEKKNKKDEYGIGLGTAQYGRLFVNCIRPGSLADRNGIIFGDEITMINESETLYCSAPQAARAMKNTLKVNIRLRIQPYTHRFTLTKVKKQPLGMYLDKRCVITQVYEGTSAAKANILTGQRIIGVGRACIPGAATPMIADLLCRCGRKVEIATMSIEVYTQLTANWVTRRS